MGLVKGRGKQRTDATRILAVVRGLNRLELVGEAMRHALDARATVAPEWLRAHVHEAWTQRYLRRLDDHRLPKSQAERQAEAERIEADGHALLGDVLSEGACEWLSRIPAVAALRNVWVQNCFPDEGATGRWRTSEAGNPRATTSINSPLDLDGRSARTCTTSWVGYRMPSTETCEDDLPYSSTDVQTAPAPTADGDATPSIHAARAETSLLPERQVVDPGFLDADLLAESKRTYGVELFGPTR